MKFLIAALFIAHAVMHWVFKPTTRGLLSGILPGTLEVLPAILWLLPTVGFLLAGLAILGIIAPVRLWRPLVFASAAISLVMLLIWHPWPWVAAALDVGILVALLLARWPIVDAVGG